MKQLRILFFLCAVFFLASNDGFTANPAFGIVNTDSTIFETLPRDSVLELTLEVDFKQIKNRKLDTYKSGKLRFADRQGAMQELEVDVKPRGNMRRKICDFPPLKIKFSKDDISKRGLKNHRKLELATICEKGENYEQYILREYLIYKLYNLMTDYSFRVQLAKVKFIDTSPKKKSFENYAILIESTEELVDRMRGKELPERYVSETVLNNDDCELFSIFQYMIGNTDWYVHNQHNVKIIGIKNTARVVPVAYDFDYAGLVEAPYSVPSSLLPITDVTQRFLKSECKDMDFYQYAINTCMAKKDAILKQFAGDAQLDRRSLKTAVNYMEDFYTIIESPDQFSKYINTSCNYFSNPETHLKQGKQ